MHSPASSHIPKVTVLLPVFNAEMFLKESVESLLNQTFTDFELLVIDDGSTDGSKKILAEYTDPRLVIIDNDGNRGLIYTLNRGLELARGKYVARMDADDISLPDRLNRQVQYLDTHPRIALLGGCAEFIDDQNKTFMTCRVPLTHDKIMQNIFRANSFIHPSVMFRTSIVRDLGGFSPEALHAEDYDLWLRIVESHEVANLAEILIRYRIHPSQISQRKLRQQRAIADRLRLAAFERCQQKGLVPADVTLANTTWWERMRGIPPSVGADYHALINTYRSMKRNDLTSHLIITAIINAPLCGQLYRELYLTITHTQSIRSLINTLLWYRKKAWFLISGKQI